MVLLLSYLAALDSSNVGKPSSIYRGVYTMTPLNDVRMFPYHTFLESSLQSPVADGVPTVEGEVKLHMISKGAGMKMVI